MFTGIGMTDDTKSSNLMIIGLGIVAMFFAYLVYMKSKDTTQSQQITDTLTLIQKQNLNLLERLTLLESTTCSNVVSMNNNTNNKDINNNINNTIDTIDTANTIDTIDNLNLVKNLKFI